VTAVVAETAAVVSIRAPDGRTWTVRRRALNLRWRAIDPGPDDSERIAMAIPAVLRLVILPFALFLVELPLVVLLATVGRRCWIVAQSDTREARMVWRVPRSRARRFEAELIEHLAHGERSAVGI
jgi:hypothetical protein